MPCQENVTNPLSSAGHRLAGTTVCEKDLMKLIVSLCNVPMGGPLCEYDLRTGETTGIRIAHPLVRESIGATGLARYRDGLLVALQTEPPVLMHLSMKYEVIAVWPLSSVEDPHSIVVYRDTPYLVSTGTNAIVRVEDGKETVHWLADCGERDCIHMNSIAWHRGRLYASAFGPRSGELWNSASEGYVIDVESRMPIMREIYHPHSIVSTEEGLVVCDSSRQRLVCENGQTLAVGGGYTRGLAVTSGQIFVGISRGRIQSRSRGAVVDNPADPGLLTLWCGIRHYFRGQGGIADARLHASIGLQDYGNEIYDIVAV